MRLYELFDLEEKYTRDNAFIRDYFRNREFDAYRYDWQMKEWLNDNADEYDVEWSEEDLEDDPQAVFNSLPKSVQDQMVRDIYDDLRDNFPTELPSTEYFQDGKLIPRNTWLVHFSYQAYDISRNGFQKGVLDVDRLGLTTHLHSSEKERPGYNFAFEANSRYAAHAASIGKYGDDFVIFQNSGYSAWHYGDEEQQVIFYGPDVNPHDIIYVENDGGDFVVKAKAGKKDELFRGDYEEVVKWVMDNFQQYRRVLTGR